MATFEHKFEIGFRDIGKNNKLTNKGLLSFLEDTASMHSNKIGYGLNTIDTTNVTWVLLNWKVRILKNPIYGETVTVKTWARHTIKFFTYRDFEVYNESNELVAIATTKWVLMNATAMKIIKIPDEIMQKYEPEYRCVFKDEDEVDYITIPNEYSYMQTYKIKRNEIDINNHVHNVAYLDFAYEVIPEEIYENCNFNDFEILYKKEAKLNATLKCFYKKQDISHYIIMKSDDEKIIHCIVKLNEKRV